MPESIGHWKGGRRVALEMESVSPTIVRRTADAALGVVRTRGTRDGDDASARILNTRGRRIGKGKPWRQLAGKTARRNHRLDGCAHSLVDADVLTLQGAWRCTKMSDTTIMRLVDGGILPIHQVVPFCGLGNRRTDLDRERARNAVARLKHTGRLVWGDTSDTQRELFL